MSFTALVVVITAKFFVFLFSTYSLLIFFYRVSVYFSIRLIIQCNIPAAINDFRPQPSAEIESDVSPAPIGGAFMMKTLILCDDESLVKYKTWLQKSLMAPASVRCIGFPLKDQHLHTSNSQYLQRRASPFFKNKRLCDVLKRLDGIRTEREPTAVCWRTKPARMSEISNKGEMTNNGRESILSIAFCRELLHADVWRLTSFLGRLHHGRLTTLQTSILTEVLRNIIPGQIA